MKKTLEKMYQIGKEKYAKRGIQERSMLYIVQSPEGVKQFRDFFEKEKPVKVIERDLHWSGLKNMYAIYKVGNYYIVRIIDEYCCLGSEDADEIAEEEGKKYYVRIHPVRWSSKTIKCMHWEDGLMYFKVLDPDDNFPQYALGLNPPSTGWKKWRDQEYRDCGWKYDDPKYDNMFYKDV